MRQNARLFKSLLRHPRRRRSNMNETSSDFRRLGSEHLEVHVILFGPKKNQILAH
jgi:hypothetical protein